MIMIMAETVQLKTAGNYQDMVWRRCISCDETWILLRENVVLPKDHIKEKIELTAAMSPGCWQEKEGFCHGSLQVQIFWEEENRKTSLQGEEDGEETYLRRGFFLEPHDGGRPALARTSSLFGISRFQGCLWQEGQEKEKNQGQSVTEVTMEWQANCRPGMEPEHSELVCLHGVRTGLRTVLLEALIRVPVQMTAEKELLGSYWQGQEEIMLELEDDAVNEVLGIGFMDHPMETGYDRDVHCLQLRWLSRLTLFYLRAPSGGGRIGMASFFCDKGTALSEIRQLSLDQAVKLIFLPARRDIEVRVLRPDRLLCRYGMYVQFLAEDLSE